MDTAQLIHPNTTSFVYFEINTCTYVEMETSIPGHHYSNKSINILSSSNYKSPEKIDSPKLRGMSHVTDQVFIIS